MIAITRILSIMKVIQKYLDRLLDIAKNLKFRKSYGSAFQSRLKADLTKISQSKPAGSAKYTSNPNFTRATRYPQKCSLLAFAALAGFGFEVCFADVACVAIMLKACASCVSPSPM